MPKQTSVPPKQPIASSAKSRRWAVRLVAAGILVLGGVIAAVSLAQRPAEDDTSQNSPAESRTYSLNLKKMTFVPGQPTNLAFDIRDQNNAVLKNFDTVHERQMHVIVVRKDRTRFQHLHPTYEKDEGTFTVDSFTLPTDGEYRIFADFTAGDAPTQSDNTKLPSTPYKDVKVGSGTYLAQQAIADKLKSDVNGFTTEITIPHSDSLITSFLAKNENTFAVDIKKDGQPYKTLETYLGALGHMVVLGPNLEFVHAHPLTKDTTQQVGLIYFRVNFPQPGMYKIYLQTKAVGKVSTFDYDLTAKELPGSTNEQPASDTRHGH